MVYPETKIPVAKRKSKGSAAPSTSPILSGLMAKRLGSGGLKLGGGAIVTDEEVEEEVSDMTRMQKLLLGALLLGKQIYPETGNWERLKAEAIAMSLEKVHFTQVPPKKKKTTLLWFFL